MIQINNNAYIQGGNLMAEASRLRLQQEKQDNDALHQQLMRQLQENQNIAKQQQDQFENQIKTADLGLKYANAGFDLSGKPLQVADSHGEDDMLELARGVFATTGVDVDKFSENAKKLQDVYRSVSDKYSKRKGSAVTQLVNKVTGDFDRTYPKEGIMPYMFADRHQLSQMLDGNLGEEIRKSLKNKDGIALTNKEWAEYKENLEGLAEVNSLISKSAGGAMMKAGFIPAAQHMDIQTQNSVASALLSGDPIAGFVKVFNSAKKSHHMLDGGGGGSTTQNTQGGQGQQQGHAQTPNNKQNYIKQPIFALPGYQQVLTPQEQAQQRQQIQQQIQNATPEERGQIRQELSMKQNAPTPEGIKQSAEDGQQIIESLQPKQKEYVDSNLEALMNGEKVVELKQATKEDKTASMAESFLAGMGKVSRDLFNIGFKYGGVNLPPEERIEKMMADNPVSAFLGEFVAYTGLSGAAVAATGVGVGTVGALGLSLGISALMHGAATADTINAEDYNSPLSLTWDLVKPNSVTDALFTYGLPIAIEGGFAVANKISKSAKAKGVEIAEKAIKAEEDTIAKSSAESKQFDSGVASTINKQAEEIIKDASEANKTTKSNILLSAEENLMKNFESKAPEELHTALQQTYINKIKPMERFGNIYKEELSKIPTKQDKLAIINKLDEMAIEGDTSFNQFQNRAVANKMGQLREDIREAKTYDDMLKVYRNINKEFDTKPESFYNRVGKRIKEDIRGQLNNITGGKFNEANKAYEEAMLMDDALGLSKRMKNSPTGGTKKSDLINREITERLKKTIDSPVYSGIRSLLAGGEEGLQQYTVGKIADVIKSGGNIKEISNALDKIANDFDSVLSKGGKASEAFTVARGAVDSIKELDGNIGRVISDLSNRIGNRSIDVPELLTKLEELSNKFNVGEFDGGISLKLANKFLNNISDGLNGVGEKYFGMNWDSVKAKVMTSIAEGKPIDKGIREGLDKLNRTNVMRGILEAELKTKPILQDFGAGSFILDQITHHASSFLKIGKTLANKAIYEPSVKRTIAEEFAKRGKIFIEPEIQNLLNIDNIARASLNISRGLIQRKMLMDILKGQRGALYAASADLGAQQN